MNRSILWLLAPLLGTSSCVGVVGAPNEQPSLPMPRPGAAPEPGAAPVPAPPGPPPRSDLPAAPEIPVPGQPAGTPAPAAGEPAPVPGALPSALHRLTRREYDNTIRDLLGDASRPARAFPRDGRGESGYLEAAPVSDHDVQLLMESAEAIAARAAASRSFLSFVGCSPASDGEEDCARRFIAGFARRAYRRPVRAAELGDLLALFRAARAELKQDFAPALGTVIQAVLQSPSFLYHREAGPASLANADADGLLPLDDHGVAARLSYTLWSSMPDDVLFAAADAGQLRTPEQVMNQARRMLNRKEKASDGVEMFFKQWLGMPHLDAHSNQTDLFKDEKLFGYRHDDAGRLFREFQRVVHDVVLEGDGKLGTLLELPYGYPDERVARHFYGLSVSVPSGTSPRVMLDPAQRIGLLGQAAFLAASSGPRENNPTVRGALIYGRLLCGTVPHPPDEVPPLPAVRPGATTRERFTEHAKAACAGCHRLLDPFGFAFEHYDPVGRFRTEEEGKPIDATGTALLPDGAKLTFKDAPELLRALARDPGVADCATEHWLRFALGRRLTPADAPSHAAVQKAFRASGGDVRELMVVTAGTRSFLTHAPILEGTR
jgi:hypothetical protein